MIAVVADQVSSEIERMYRERTKGELGWVQLLEESLEPGSERV